MAGGYTRLLVTSEPFPLRKGFEAMRVIRDWQGTVDIDGFLARPLFAHLATASPEGPRDSPVWFLWEEGALWIIGNRRTDTFPARLQGEPRCAVGMVDFDATTGRVEHVGMRGRAMVVAFDAGRARRLLRRYLGAAEDEWDERFRATLGDVENVLVRFVPETTVARDQSYAIRGRGRATSSPWVP